MPDPSDRAISAMQTAVDSLVDAHEQASNAAEAGAAEQELVTEFVDDVAQALADGLDQPVGLYAGAVAEETEYYSKTDLKQQIKDKTEEYRSGDKQPLDEFILERLEEVTVVKTTDHLQGAEYIWDFAEFKVETVSGKDGRGHFLFSQFRDLIHESGGVNTAKPTKDRRGGEEWRDFMVDMIDQRGTEQYTRGPRTEAYEQLKNKIKRLTGYGTAEAALDHTGVWVIREEVDLPDWWASLGEQDPGDDRDLPQSLVTEIRVHESLIKPVLESAGITRSAFYHELSARGHTISWTSGASMTEWVNGSHERFWTLEPDAACPRTYVPDPNSGTAVNPDLFDYGEMDTGSSKSKSTASAASTTAPSGTGQIADAGENSSSTDNTDDDDGFDSVGEIQ